MVRLSQPAIEQRLYEVRYANGRRGQVADPNPFPADGVVPLICSALEPGTAKRRPLPEGVWFDKKAADDAVAFFPRHLRHTQGPLAGQPFELVPEQQWLIREAFGWKWLNENGVEVRLYRNVYVEMGRGNGKSQLGAGVAGKLMFADGEANPEVVGAAKDREQARIILNRLKAMVRESPSLKKRAEILRGEIRRRKDDGRYKATSADVGGAWGGAPHGIIFDEIHAQPNRELWDALVTGMGKRLQPMVWAFTTAGWDRESLCWELHDFTRQLSEGTAVAPTFLGVIWAAAEDADWTDPGVWKSANPLLGKAISLAEVNEKCEYAKAVPAFQNVFRTMYLSQWVGQEVRFIPMEHWDECGGEIQPGKRPAFGGLDLSSTTDLSAYVVVSRRGDNVDVDVRLYAPADGVKDRERRDRVPYTTWAQQGLLTLTPGPTIDQDWIKADILRSADVYDLKDVNYDRWNATKLAKELENEGVEMVQIGQGFASLSAPTKELLRLVVEHKLNHGGHPILRWMANNTAGQVDAAENVKPDKAKSTGRIDGIAALVNALDGLTRRGSQPVRRSAYEDHGLILA